MVDIYSDITEEIMVDFVLRQLVKDFFSKYSTKSNEEATQYFLEQSKILKKAEGVTYTDEQMQNDLEIFLNYVKEIKDKNRYYYDTNFF